MSKIDPTKEVVAGYTYESNQDSNIKYQIFHVGDQFVMSYKEVGGYRRIRNPDIERCLNLYTAKLFNPTLVPDPDWREVELWAKNKQTSPICDEHIHDRYGCPMAKTSEAIWDLESSCDWDEPVKLAWEAKFSGTPASEASDTEMSVAMSDGHAQDTNPCAEVANEKSKKSVSGIAHISDTEDLAKYFDIANTLSIMESEKKKLYLSHEYSERLREELLGSIWNPAWTPIEGVHIKTFSEESPEESGKCQCDIKQLMESDHDPECPEKRG